MTTPAEYQPMTRTLRQKHQVRGILQHHVKSLKRCVIKRPRTDNAHWIAQRDAFDVGDSIGITPFMLPQVHTIDYFEFAVALLDFERRFIQNPRKYAMMIDLTMHDSLFIPDFQHDLSCLPMLTPEATHMAVVARFRVCASYLLALSHTPHPPHVMSPLDPMLTVSMGTHPRLGRDSPLSQLGEDIIDRHILPHLYADEQYVAALFAPGIQGLFRPHADTRMESNHRRIAPSPILHTNVADLVAFNVLFRNPDGTTTHLNDQNITPELFRRIPKSSVSLFIRENNQVYLIMYNAITINTTQHMRALPVRNAKISKAVTWTHRQETSINVNDMMTTLDTTFTLHTSHKSETYEFMFDGWGHLRYHLSFGAFSPRDLQQLRDDARPRVVQVRD